MRDNLGALKLSHIRKNLQEVYRAIHGGIVLPCRGATFWDTMNSTCAVSHNYSIRRSLNEGQPRGIKIEPHQEKPARGVQGYPWGNCVALQGCHGYQVG